MKKANSPRVGFFSLNSQRALGVGPCASATMDFSIAYYNYVNVFETGVLAALVLTLLFKRTRRVPRYAAYRKARNSLAAVFFIIIVDLSLSLLINNSEGVASNIDTSLDILCYTPVAILMTWISSWLVGDSREYRSQAVRDISVWLVTTVIVVGTVLFPDAGVMRAVHMAVTVFWALFICRLGYCVTRNFRRSVRRLNNYYSNNAVAPVVRLRNGFMLFVAFGLCAPIAAICPPWFNTIYMIVGGLVYTTLCNSLLNYYDSFDVVDRVVHAPSPSRCALSADDKAQIRWKIKEWEASKGFRAPDITIEELARGMGRDSGEVANMINETYDRTFRQHVDRLRLDDAQELLVHYPDKSVDDVALMLGYDGGGVFAANFKRAFGVSPDEWRASVLKLIS